MTRLDPFTPVEWFIAIAHSLRRQIPGSSIPIVVFTDGSNDEVGRLLEIDNVHLHQRRTAITDLWALSQARLLIASGFSTFSMWASYLGGMPTVYAPSKIQEHVQIGRPGAIEITLAANEDVPAAAFRSLM